MFREAKIWIQQRTSLGIFRRNRLARHWRFANGHGIWDYIFLASGSTFLETCKQRQIHYLCGDWLRLCDCVSEGPRATSSFSGIWGKMGGHFHFQHDRDLASPSTFGHWYGDGHWGGGLGSEQYRHFHLDAPRVECYTYNMGSLSQLSTTSHHWHGCEHFDDGLFARHHRHSSITWRWSTTSFSTRRFYGIPQLLADSFDQHFSARRSFSGTQGTTTTSSMEHFSLDLASTTFKDTDRFSWSNTGMDWGKQCNIESIAIHMEIRSPTDFGHLQVEWGALALTETGIYHNWLGFGARLRPLLMQTRLGRLGGENCSTDTSDGDRHFENRKRHTFNHPEVSTFHHGTTTMDSETFTRLRDDENQEHASIHNTTIHPTTIKTTTTTTTTEAENTTTNPQSQTHKHPPPITPCHYQHQCRTTTTNPFQFDGNGSTVQLFT